MKKFYIQTIKGSTSLIEVHGRILPRSDSFVVNLHENEYGFEVFKPESLKGEKIMWFALFDEEEEAMNRLKKELTHEVERKLSKGQLEEERATEYYEDRLNSVKIVRL